MQYKIDLKDKRILHELDINAEATTLEIAKKVRLSQQVVDYRIKNMIKNDVIMGFFTLVNITKLGYSFYRVHFRFKHITGENKKIFDNYFLKNSNIFWSAFVGGKWDYIADFFSESIVEFNKNLQGILTKFKELIQNYEVLTVVFLQQYSHQYLLNKNDERYKPTIIGEEYEQIKLDKLDAKILSLIKNNIRKPYLEVGKALNISRNTVKYRINNLKKERIIIGSRLFFRPSKLGYESYKVFFSLKNYTKDDEDSLISFAKLHPNIIYSLKLIGRWNIDFEIEVKNREELQNLIIEIRNKFPFIDEYEIMPIFRDTKVDYFPMEQL